MWGVHRCLHARRATEQLTARQALVCWPAFSAVNCPSGQRPEGIWAHDHLRSGRTLAIRGSGTHQYTGQIRTGAPALVPCFLPTTDNFLQSPVLVTPAKVGEGSGTPPQCSCLETPMDGGAWWAAVRGVAGSDTTEATSQSRTGPLGRPEPGGPRVTPEAGRGRPATG